MTDGACILARFSDQEKLIPAAARLSSDKAIARWDAVDGHVQLIAWASDPRSGRASIEKLDGIEQVVAYESTATANMTGQLESSRSYAYVFLEIEPSKRDRVARALGEIPEVIGSAPARGGCDLIALVAGETFSHVDAAVRERIRPLDGVLRLKQNRIIDLKQL